MQKEKQNYWDPKDKSIKTEVKKENKKTKLPEKNKNCSKFEQKIAFFTLFEV